MLHQNQTRKKEIILIKNGTIKQKEKEINQKPSIEPFHISFVAHIPEVKNKTPHSTRR